MLATSTDSYTFQSKSASFQNLMTQVSINLLLQSGDREHEVHCILAGFHRLMMLLGWKSLSVY